MTDTIQNDAETDAESTDDRPAPDSAGERSQESDEGGWQSFAEDDDGASSEGAAGTGFSSDVVRPLAWAALVVLSILAVVALIGFYRGIGATIDLWIDPGYQPIVSAAFNLVVLLGSLVGVSLVVRELA